MSYAFDAALAAGFNPVTADLRLLIVMTGSQVDPATAGAYFGLGQPSAANLAAIVGIAECADGNYSRKTFAGKAGTVNTSTSPHRSQFTFTALEYTPAIGTLSPTACGAIAYVEGASDALRVPIWYFNNSPLFPWEGGADLYLTYPTGGSVRVEAR